MTLQLFLSDPMAIWVSMLFNKKTPQRLYWYLYTVDRLVYWHKDHALLECLRQNREEASYKAQAMMWMYLTWRMNSFSFPRPTIFKCTRHGKLNTSGNDKEKEYWLISCNTWYPIINWTAGEKKVLQKLDISYCKWLQKHLKISLWDQDQNNRLSGE